MPVKITRNHPSQTPSTTGRTRDENASERPATRREQLLAQQQAKRVAEAESQQRLRDNARKFDAAASEHGRDPSQTPQNAFSGERAMSVGAMGRTEVQRVMPSDADLQRVAHDPNAPPVFPGPLNTAQPPSSAQELKRHLTTFLGSAYNPETGQQITADALCESLHKREVPRTYGGYLTPERKTAAASPSVNNTNTSQAAASQDGATSPTRSTQRSAPPPPSGVSRGSTASAPGPTFSLRGGRPATRSASASGRGGPNPGSVNQVYSPLLNDAAYDVFGLRNFSKIGDKFLELKILVAFILKKMELDNRFKSHVLAMKVDLSVIDMKKADIVLKRLMQMADLIKRASGIVFSARKVDRDVKEVANKTKQIHAIRAGRAHPQGDDDGAPGADGRPPTQPPARGEGRAAAGRPPTPQEDTTRANAHSRPTSDSAASQAAQEPGTGDASPMRRRMLAGLAASIAADSTNATDRQAPADAAPEDREAPATPPAQPPSADGAESSADGARGGHGRVGGDGQRRQRGTTNWVDGLIPDEPDGVDATFASGEEKGAIDIDSAIDPLLEYAMSEQHEAAMGQTVAAYQELASKVRYPSAHRALLAQLARAANAMAEYERSRTL